MIDRGKDADREAYERLLRELAASEERYRSLAETIPHIVWVADHRGRVQHWNRRWYEYTGLPEDAPADAILAVVHPDDIPTANKQWQWAIRTGALQDCELRLRSATGDYRWFLVRGLPVAAVEGARPQIFGTCTDIHDRKTAEMDQAFLYRVGERMRGASTREILTDTLTETGRYLALGRCVYAEADRERDTVEAQAEYVDGVQSLLGIRVPVTAYHPAINEMVRAGLTIVRSDLATDPTAAGPWASLYATYGVGASVVIPIRGHDENEVALLAAHSPKPRAWQPREVSLLETIAERIRLLVDNDRLARAAKRETDAQHQLLRDVLASVTDGHLILAENDGDLPAELPRYGEPIEIGSAGALAAIRDLAAQAAVERGYSQERVYDLTTAVGEAATNAVKHGGGQASAHVEVDTDTVRVRIVDHGAGIKMHDLPRATLARGYSTAATMGHGFKIILQTIDRIWLRTGPTGTTVVLDQDRTPPLPSWLQ